jgi:hypothetical protein
MCKLDPGTHMRCIWFSPENQVWQLRTSQQYSPLMLNQREPAPQVVRCTSLFRTLNRKAAGRRSPMCDVSRCGQRWIRCQKPLLSSQCNRLKSNIQHFLTCSPIPRTHHKRKTFEMAPERKIACCNCAVSVSDSSVTRTGRIHSITLVDVAGPLGHPHEPNPSPLRTPRPAFVLRTKQQAWPAPEKAQFSHHHHPLVSYHHLHLLLTPQQTNHHHTNCSTPHTTQTAAECRRLNPLTTPAATCHHSAPPSRTLRNLRGRGGIAPGAGEGEAMEVRGLGQLLAALAAALFVRAIAGPGPALLPPAEDTEGDETDAEVGEGGGGVPPVTIRWARITCALKNKRGEVVSRCRRHGTTTTSSHLAAAARAKPSHSRIGWPLSSSRLVRCLVIAPLVKSQSVLWWLVGAGGRCRWPPLCCCRTNCVICIVQVSGWDNCVMLYDYDMLFTIFANISRQGFCCQMCPGRRNRGGC